MNRKGFTLIEIIMVIAIIGIIMLLIVPNVMTVINKNNTKSCKNIEESIKRAAELYVTDHKYDLGFSCSSTTKNIKLDDLVKADYLKTDNGEIINPFNDSVVYSNTNNSRFVTVTYNCSTKLFTCSFSLTCE